MSAQTVLPIELQEKALVPVSPTPMDLLGVALSRDAAIDVIERLAALQERQRDYEAHVSFDEALNRCQAKLSRISADANNSSTNSKYASYAKIDRVVRPIYTAEGFSVSFGERDCPTPGKTRFVAYLCRAGVTREYLKDMTPSTKGPKGADVMTPVHADASVDSYAKRYLVKDIFNVAIGEEDTDGSVTNGELAEQIEYLGNASTPEELDKLYAAAYKIFDAKDNWGAIKALIAAKKARKAERGW
jgi:hypothetical protein